MANEAVASTRCPLDPKAIEKISKIPECGVKMVLLNAQRQMERATRYYELSRCARTMGASEADGGLRRVQIRG